MRNDRFSLKTAPACVIRTKRHICLKLILAPGCGWRTESGSRPPQARHWSPEQTGQVSRLFLFLSVASHQSILSHLILPPPPSSLLWGLISPGCLFFSFVFFIRSLCCRWRVLCSRKFLFEKCWTLLCHPVVTIKERRRRVVFTVFKLRPKIYTTFNTSLVNEHIPAF